MPRRTLSSRQRLALAVATGLGVVAGATTADAQTAGINMGAPVYDGVVAIDAVTAAVGTGAAHVRVNFRLDEWKSPTDATKVNGKTFFEAYDGIIEAITSQGLEVYGLLNDELVSSGAPGSTELEDSYAANALAVVDRYKDRVRVWETINEPNDYGGGAWKAVRDALGHDPIDDVGYHLYVAQGPDSAPSQVGASGGANLDAMHARRDDGRAG